MAARFPRMRSLAAAIARTEFYLRLLPSPLARRAAILARLNKETDADESIVHLHDDIGRFAGGMFWPFKPMRLLQMPALGPAFHLLTPLSDLHREIWAARPGMAAAFPDGLFLGSLSYRHVYGALDERYVAYFPYPCRAGGEQVVVFLVRNRSRTMPFGERAY